MFACLFFELGHAVQPAHSGNAIQDPGKLRVAADLGLVEDDVLFRIDARRDKGGGYLTDIMS